MKTIGGLRKLRHRGGALVDWVFTFTAAAYNIVRMRRLLRPGHRVTSGSSDRGPERYARTGRHVVDVPRQLREQS